MKQKRSDQLREAIEEEIVMGRLPPGSRIDDTALAVRFGEMFEVMAELEAMCARRAARRSTEAQQRALLSALDLTRKAGETRDVDAYFHENEGFHQAIYAASQNAFLIEQTRLLQRRLRPYRRLQLRVRDRMSNSQAEHEAITAAIIAGDADLAAEHIRGHVVIQGERFGDLVASLAEWRAGAESANEELPARARARAVG